MKVSYLLALLGIGCITFLEALAITQGIDGNALALSLASLSAIVTKLLGKGRKTE